MEVEEYDITLRQAQLALVRAGAQVEPCEEADIVHLLTRLNASQSDYILVLRDKFVIDISISLESKYEAWEVIERIRKVSKRYLRLGKVTILV